MHTHIQSNGHIFLTNLLVSPIRIVLHILIDTYRQSIRSISSLFSH